MTCAPWLAFWFCAATPEWQVRPVELGLVVDRDVYPAERRCATIPSSRVRTGVATEVTIVCHKLPEAWYLRLERCVEHRLHYDGKEEDEAFCYWETENVRVTELDWVTHPIGMRFSR